MQTLLIHVLPIKHYAIKSSNYQNRDMNDMRNRIRQEGNRIQQANTQRKR